jgi:hypothetical protein
MTTIERIGPPTAKDGEPADDVKHAVLRADDELVSVIWQLSVAEAALDDRDIDWPHKELHAGLSTLLSDQCGALQRLHESLSEYRERYIRPHSALNGQSPSTARRALELSGGSAHGALAKPKTMRYSAAGLT